MNMLVFVGALVAGQPWFDLPSAETRLDIRTLYFKRESSRVVGAKGEDILPVTPTRDASGNLWVFDRVELVVDRERFGAAQFTSVPKSGCIKCDPIVIKWYHEPTGFVRFQVFVWRRIAEQQDLMIKREREDQ